MSGCLRSQGPDDLSDDVPKLRAAHKVLLEVPFTPQFARQGLHPPHAVHRPRHDDREGEAHHRGDESTSSPAGEGSDSTTSGTPITPQTKWNDADNTLVISPGPISGNPQYGRLGGKSLVVTLCRR